ncbi:hypothetical protein OZD62_00365 [Wolbachia endosymbiont of Drosophila seguyi]|nr:hypothetical protein [Wolbachia endosymbiont of Drosophila seguyi]MDE5065422.1 hypothetical protein [Wolbachia endosymbiont of Drosophila seguyi]
MRHITSSVVRTPRDLGTSEANADADGEGEGERAEARAQNRVMLSSQ